MSPSYQTVVVALVLIMDHPTPGRKDSSGANPQPPLGKV
jgi:hypothetical protein